MEATIVARVVHVIGVVLWIGGVAMVTTALLPTVRHFAKPEDRVAFFEKLEGRFAAQARITTLLTGLSGFYLVYAYDAWDRYLSLSYWWLHAMTGVWVLFTLMLFVFEPLFLHAWFMNKARSAPETTFRLVSRMHVFLLTISLLTVAGAVAGSHGWLFP